jgi:alkylhydroperoxidase/carboxymuconolactone decarboxylase family protein YurZ
VQAHERTLRKLAICDEVFVESLLGEKTAVVADSGLDLKTQALVRLGALISLGAVSPSYMSAVDAARGAGASTEEIVGTLIAVLPVLGPARIVSAAPELGLALGYDVAEALESCETSADPPATAQPGRTV